MDSKVPQLLPVSTDSRSASSFEDVFDSERRKKKLDAERRKKEKDESTKEQKHNGIKKFISSIGDGLVSFYDSSFLAVQPPKPWNPNKDLSAAVLSNPLFMCAYVDDKICGYVDDRVELKETQQPQAPQRNVFHTGAQVKFHEGSDIPDVRRTLAYVKSTDQILNEICETTLANARKEFLTRESLEDAIAMNVEAAEAGDEEADEELRRLFPLRFILPTAADMNEMIEALQKKKTDAMRRVNLAQANEIQAEIDELEYQVHKEQTHIRKREMSLTHCVACDQKFSIREVKPGEMLHCKECRQVFSDDVSSTTFTLTQCPVKSPLSIKVINKGKGSIPLIPSDDDLVDL